MKRFVLKFLKAGIFIYGLLFLVFYYDIDGKLIYYVVEPFLQKRYDEMERADKTKTPYEMKGD